MPFPNFLDMLPPEGSVPGFAGGHFGGIGRGATEEWNPPINEMGGIQNALAQNAMRAPQQKRGVGFADILGAIGDAMLVANGNQPIYMGMKAQRREDDQRQQVNAALQNYMDDPEAAIRALLAIDAPAAIELMNGRKGKDPEEIALMRAVGIDPNSEEGRQIITGRLRGGGTSDPNFVRELEALGIDPRSDEARELYYGRNSPAGYLLRPPSRSAGSAPSGGPAVGQVVNGFRFRGGNPNDRNSWEPAGGQTASPSGPFPSAGN